MNITNLTTITLKKLLTLHERREALVAKVNQLDVEIAALTGSPATPAKPARKPARPAANRKPSTTATPTKGKGRRAGRTAKRIVKALKAAGPKGMTVKDLSAALKIKTQNLYVWFNSTGRTTPGIQKIGKATYAMVD